MKGRTKVGLTHSKLVWKTCAIVYDDFMMNLGDLERFGKIKKSEIGAHVWSDLGY